MSPSVKPFNEAKYKALMDGLECSEVLFPKLKTITKNIDLIVNFFKKSF